LTISLLIHSWQTKKYQRLCPAGMASMQQLLQRSWYFACVKKNNRVRTKKMIVLLEEASDVVAFIVVEGMPDGTGAPHSLHWDREIKKGITITH
jgi:hypothetical protein